MKEKPTTFQLAQLAAQAAPPNTRAKDAVRRALDLWSEAETGIAEYENRRAYLHGLFHTPGGREIPIFADSPEDWRASRRETRRPGKEDRRGSSSEGQRGAGFGTNGTDGTHERRMDIIYQISRTIPWARARQR